MIMTDPTNTRQVDVESIKETLIAGPKTNALAFSKGHVKAIVRPLVMAIGDLESSFDLRKGDLLIENRQCDKEPNRVEGVNLANTVTPAAPERGTHELCFQQSRSEEFDKPLLPIEEKLLGFGKVRFGRRSPFERNATINHEPFRLRGHRLCRRSRSSFSSARISSQPT